MAILSCLQYFFYSLNDADQARAIASRLHPSCSVEGSRNVGFRLLRLRFSRWSDTRTSIQGQIPIARCGAQGDKRNRHRYALWSELLQWTNRILGTLSPSCRSGTIGKPELRPTLGQTRRWRQVLALSCTTRLQCSRFRLKTRLRSSSNQGLLTAREPALRYRPRQKTNRTSRNLGVGL
jgi:hypothetical protein